MRAWYPRTTTWLWLSFFACAVFAACKPSDPFRVRPGTVFVAARDTFFTPDTIHVGVGLPVRWTNEGALYHSVVADSGAFSSGLLQHNAWFEVRFDSTATISYHCSEHPVMVGTVVVDP
jgi:plastocyanin